MTASIAALRSKDEDGRVALSEAPTTPAGSVLGIALLADSSPPRSHDHRDGRRLVTAALAIQVHPDGDGHVPAYGDVQGLMGHWPIIHAEGRVYASSGFLLASSHATFVGLTVDARARTPGVGEEHELTSLDASADRLIHALWTTWRWEGTGRGMSRFAVLPELRNRYGPMHGAAAYAAMALLSLGAARGEKLRALEHLDPREQVLDARARFLRPILMDEVEVHASVVRRARRLVDVECAITSRAGEMLAVGQSTILRRG